MTERREQLPVGERPEVEVRLPSGQLRVTEGRPGQIVVDIRGPDADRFKVRSRDGGVSVGLEEGFGVRWHPHDVVVAVPAGTSLDARVGSAGVSVETDLAALEVSSGSGTVVAGAVSGAVVVRTGAGDVRLRSAGGDVRLSSASGDFEVGEVGASVVANTAAGDVRLGSVAGALSVRSASGDVDVERYAGGDVSCATVSGDVSIGVVAGRTLDLDLFSLAGAVSNEFDVDSPDGDGSDGGAVAETGRVSVRSTAGDIALRRAVETGA